MWKIALWRAEVVQVKKDVKMSNRCEIVNVLCVQSPDHDTSEHQRHRQWPFVDFAKCSNIQKYHLKHPVDLLINIINDNNPQ